MKWFNNFIKFFIESVIDDTLLNSIKKYKQ